MMDNNTEHRHKRRVYLDNSATTQPYPEVILKMGQVMYDTYGNPSSQHSAGHDARITVEQARRTIASLTGALPSEIFFTSGGTESDNTVLRAARGMGIRRIISSHTEHHAVTATLGAIVAENASFLPYMNISAEYVDLDTHGRIDMAGLENMLRVSDGKTLVSLMHANNETGNLYDLRAIGELCRKYGALFHTDAVQTAGHYPLDLKELPVDFLSASAHKFHGPKGVGFLFARSGTGLRPMISGGEQERGMRSGTENVPAIAAMALAFQMGHDDMDADREHVLSLKKRLLEGLSVINGVRFNGLCECEDESMYSLVSVTLPVKKDSGMALLALDMAGVEVSAGSACMSGAWRPSEVISRLYGPSDDMPGCPTLRISMSKFNTTDDIDFAVAAIRKLV